VTEEDGPLEPDPEEPEPTPPKEEIRIVEMSESGEATMEKMCKVCQELKPAYVEVESEGVIEYTCKNCFEKDVADTGKSCWSCDTSIKDDDAFCGKCGSPAEKKCSECGEPAKDDDAFCGKCGSKL
jgi:hypothetical protein